MHDALLLAGRLLGGVGILVCLMAVLTRLVGNYTVGGFEVGTLFLGGTAAMVAGCFCLLLRMASPR